MIVFEFFSGIGGMHQALNNIEEMEIKKIFPFDINQNANLTYLNNFAVKPFEISIESFTIEEYHNICECESINNNLMWVMSPPCQPFTRQGLEKDLEDERTNGFVHLIKLFSETKFPPNFILLENVKNFEVCIYVALIIIEFTGLYFV